MYNFFLYTNTYISLRAPERWFKLIFRRRTWKGKHTYKSLVSQRKYIWIFICQRTTRDGLKVANSRKKLQERHGCQYAWYVLLCEIFCNISIIHACMLLNLQHTPSRSGDVSALVLYCRTGTVIHVEHKQVRTSVGVQI